MILKRCLSFLVLVSTSVCWAHPSEEGSTAVFQLRPKEEKAKAQPERQIEKKPQLSKEEEAFLKRGPMKMSTYVIGGLLGTYPGLGIGHMVQGRFAEQGWKYTVGEAASALLIVTSIDTNRCTGSLGDISKNRHCTDRGRFTTGAVLYAAFRLWEIFDIWYAPIQLHKRYKKLQKKSQESQVTIGLRPALGSLQMHIGYSF